MTGRKTRETSTSGGASISAARSGTEKEMFFGHHLAEHHVQEGHQHQGDDEGDDADHVRRQRRQSERDSSRWWMAGSDTLRISSEQTVMPSWLVASIKRGVLHRVQRGLGGWLPASARGSIWERRAEMTANSAPTKKALQGQQDDEPIRPGSVLAHRSASLRASPLELVDDHVVLARHRARRSIGVKRSRSTRLPSTRSTRSVPSSTLDLVAELGDPVQLVGDEAGDGLVLLVVGHLDAGPLEQLVGAQRGVEDHRPAVADHAGPGAVVLVLELADELLDQVLEGDQPGGAAVLVGDDGDLEARRGAAARAACRRPWTAARTAAASSGPRPALARARSADSAKACLTCTTPRMSSGSSPMTGKPGVAGRASDERDDLGRGVVVVHLGHLRPAASSRPRRSGRRTAACGRAGWRGPGRAALGGRAADQGAELLGACGRRTAPPSARCPATGSRALAVLLNSSDQRLEDGGEHGLERHHHLGGAPAAARGRSSSAPARRCTIENRVARQHADDGADPRARWPRADPAPVSGPSSSRLIAGSMV